MIPTKKNPAKYPKQKPVAFAWVIKLNYEQDKNVKPDL